MVKKKTAPKFCRRQFMVLERSLFKKSPALWCALSNKKQKYEHILGAKTENFLENNSWEKRKTIFRNGFLLFLSFFEQFSLYFCRKWLRLAYVVFTFIHIEHFIDGWIAAEAIFAYARLTHSENVMVELVLI